MTFNNHVIYFKIC